MKVKRLPSDTLCHYGVKGQRWGVITKEYEPVGTRSSGASDPRRNNNPVYNNNSDPRKRKKVTTGYSKGVKRRGEGLGNTTPAGRQDAYIGRRNKFNDDYINFARKQKYSQVAKCSSVDYQVDPSLKDNQISYKKVKDADGYDQYTFTFKDEETYERWSKALGLDNDTLIEKYNEWKKEEGADAAYADLEQYAAQTINGNMLALDTYGTLTMKTGEVSDIPYANFEEFKGDYNQIFPAMAMYGWTDEEGNVKPEHRRKKKGYLSENNQRDKESGKMDDAEAKLNRRKYYMREAAKSAQRAEQIKAYNKKLSTKAKRLGQSFKEVYSEGFNKIFKKKNNLKHSDIYSNVRRLPPDELRHSGIKGQRRGIRRFQYLNGTYTAAGNQRYRPKEDKRKLTKENAEKTFYLGITATALAALTKIAIPSTASTGSAALGSAAVASVLSGPVASIVLPAAVISGSAILADAVMEDLKKEK